MTVRTALALRAIRRAVTATSAASRLSSLLLTANTSLLQQPSRPSLSRAFSQTHPSHRPSPTSIPMATDTATSTATPDSIDAEFLTKKLQQSLQITHVSVEDMSGGCGQAFNAIIVSPEFEKKTLLARSRLVNGVLKEEISAIHAWTPRCLTPEQWEKEKERIGQ